MPSPQLVTFSIPGQTPDTRITIFQLKELHVHSSILKLYSAYFRKFMDSPDKDSAPPSAMWKYDWTEKVEEDGSWYVVDKRGQEFEEQQSVNSRDDMDIVAFENVIMSMYQKPYEITCTAHLQEITTLADFYRCLPVVSNSLYSAFFRSPKFLADIKEDREILLELSCKLRHRELFNDCLVLISGYWSPDEFAFSTKIEDTGLATLAENVHNRVGTLLARNIQSILIDTRNTVHAGDYLKAAVSGTAGSLVKYHVKLQKSLSPMHVINDITKNNLKLNTSAVAGEGDYVYNFLCIELKEEDIPWDTTETDW
ncbi:uncharacterized protein EAF01_002941 [Botrytis porri]|uniref:BTB domain-containing protein n=1 Tax=Botrytis porri TaxID=87229 RepID=A0A4Z1KTF6_9HELO|nr:uncharacterized protein EAF01_002941 [Botrytis porri]KAF7911434.1 hypothetical protein EAF01_002941 [Botrytis porri]TGO87445.1 hypothetical protein BPOR_0225g00040 [Botrytis porri]